MLCEYSTYKLNIRSVTLRLAPLLPTNVAVVHFPNVRKATEAVIEIMNQGVGIREYLTPSFPRSHMF